MVTLGKVYIEYVTCIRRPDLNPFSHVCTVKLEHWSYSLHVMHSLRPNDIVWHIAESVVFACGEGVICHASSECSRLHRHVPGCNDELFIAWTVLHAAHQHYSRKHALFCSAVVHWLCSDSLSCSCLILSSKTRSFINAIFINLLRNLVQNWIMFINFCLKLKVGYFLQFEAIHLLKVY